MSPRESYFDKSVCLDGFMGDKEESSLEIAEPIPIKARDPILRTRKKIGPTVSLETVKQTALTIADYNEEEAPTPKKRAHSYKSKRKGVKTPSETTIVQPNPKN